MRGWDYHPTVGLVLSGGVECRGCGVECRRCESIAGVERTTDSGSTFEELKSWGPWGLYQHCLKIVDEDRLFVAGGMNRVGGGDKMREASMYRFSTDSWTALNPMTHWRAGHTCSLVENYGGQKQIVVTGGWKGYYYYGVPVVLDSVEIWDLDTGLWQAGG